MKLNCRKCAAEIPAKNVNIQKMVGQCAVCGHLFDFSDELCIGLLKQEQKVSLPPKPEKMIVGNQNLEMHIQWRWFHWSAVFLILFSIFWNGIMFSTLGIGIIGAFQAGNIWMAFGMMLIPHVWVGLGIGYYSLAMLFNSTHVSVDLDSLVIKHGPFPWFGHKSIERETVQQLYSKENNSSFNRKNNLSQGNFELHAITGQGKQSKLLRGLPSSEHPLFLESIIEKHWAIEDYPVRGEIAR
ncbi:MAG: hypothetical protein ACI9EW_000572 [Cellvibrionaceae bacterium]|jgi:hypothetical protein